MTFVLATLVIVGWAVCGPIFHFSDTWQLVVNTGTTVITFLMVFLIQSTQNRDAQAVQVKLDELLRVSSGAQNVLMDLEDLDEQELDRIRGLYVRLAHAARTAPKTGEGKESKARPITGGQVSPEINSRASRPR
jgi:low affinity Fe/Cu permease